MTTLVNIFIHWCFLIVHFYVSVPLGFIRKAVATFRTFEWPFPLMHNLFVGFESSTSCAFKGHFVYVNFSMPLERRLSWKWFLTRYSGQEVFFCRWREVFFLFIWKGSQWIVVVVGLCTIFFLVCWGSIWVVVGLGLCQFSTWQARFLVLLELLLQSVQGNTGCSWTDSSFTTHLSAF